MSDQVHPTDEGGDPACWLDEVCDVCGRVPDTPATLDADAPCAACREAGRTS